AGGQAAKHKCQDSHHHECARRQAQAPSRHVLVTACHGLLCHKVNLSCQLFRIRICPALCICNELQNCDLCRDSTLDCGPAAVNAQTGDNTSTTQSSWSSQENNISI